MRIPVQELVEMYKDNIYAAAFNICKSAADAEDVVQAIFIMLLREALFNFFAMIVVLYNKEYKANKKLIKKIIYY